MRFKGVVVLVGLWLSTNLAGMSVVPTEVVSQDQPARELFAVAPAAVAAADRVADPTVVRARRVTVNSGMLPDAADQAPGRGARLRLNLFDDVDLTATLDRLDHTQGGFVWVGHVDDVPMSSVTLSWSDGVIGGIVFADDDVYSVRFVGDQIHEIAQIDQSRFPRERPERPEPPRQFAPASARPDQDLDDQADDGTTIDVLVLYTPAARANQGGVSGIMNLINTSVSLTNTSYANSFVTQRLRLVGAQEVSYTESLDIQTDLDRLRLAVSSALGTQAASLRNSVGADIVTLLTHVSAPDDCGIGRHLTTTSGQNGDPNSFGFNVVEATCAAANLSYPHELGHNMGGNHDWFVSNSVTPQTYAHGYVSTAARFRTIMAYSDKCAAVGVPCTRVPYWSNPSVTFSGVPMGIPGGTKATCPTGNPSDTDCDADDHRTLNNTAFAVANFRQAITRIIALSGDLAFGSVAVGSTATRTLTISNTGTASLTVSSISYPVGFSGSWSGTIAPGGSQQVLVTFAAISLGSYGGSITVNGDQTGGANTILASGTAVVVPGDVNGDSLPDLIWHNYTTGANLVWYLNGTSLAGQASLPTVTDLAWQLVANADINQDGHLDLLWRNGATGENVVWYLNGAALLSQASLPTVSDLAWQLVASADINRDGRPDLIWRNTVSGVNRVWYLNGTSVIAQGDLPSVTDLAWQIVATADINRDGRVDVIWRNTQNGANAVWYLDGATLLGQANLPSVGDLTWRLLSATDVNRDGAADLIWRNTVTGENRVWYLNGVTLQAQASFPTVTDLTWQMLGATLPPVAADANGDRHPDLIWRNTATGANLVWYLNGVGLLGQASLPAVPDLSWQIVAVTDVNGDTHPDLVWRNTSTGANLVWYLNGASLVSQASLPSVPDPAWKIAAAADVNGDAHPDLIWRNTSTGANVVWYLNGTALLSQASLTSVPDLAWQLTGSADINRDTHPDLIWRNTATGANLVWYLNGTSLLSQAALPALASPAWTIVGTADVDGDAHPDLVWRNTQTGDNTVWYLNGTALLSQANVPSVPDTNWTVRSGG